MISILYTGLIIVAIAIVSILMGRDPKLRKIIFPIYLILLLITFICYITGLIGYKNLITEFLGSLWIYTAFGLVMIHSTITKGRVKTGIFYLLALIFGSVPEIIGVTYGTIFGHYYYNPILTPFIFGVVPLTTVISWMVILYISYTVSDIVIKSGSKKPNFKRDHFVYALTITVLLAVISGLVAANLDMIIDPVVVTTQGWIWIGGGPYYGIPLSNFVGWFLIAFSATLIFRLIESLQKEDSTEDDYSGLDLAVIGIYVMFFVIYGLSAILLGHEEYLLIGTTTMGPFIIISLLLLFIKRKEG
jgi:putative membrane protein